MTLDNSLTVYFYSAVRKNSSYVEAHNRVALKDFDGKRKFDVSVCKSV